MDKLTISKEFFVYSIEGKTFFNSSELKAGLVVAGMLDLLEAEVVILNKKKIEVNTQLPEALSYLIPIYEYVAVKSRKMETVIEAFCLSVTEKKIKELINNVGEALTCLNQARADQRGILKKDVYIPDQIYKDELLTLLKSNVLGSDELDERDYALLSLLEAVGILKKYFSKDEIKTLKKKMKEAKEKSSDIKIKRMVNYTESIVAVGVASAVSTISAQ